MTQRELDDVISKAKATNNMLDMAAELLKSIEDDLTDGDKDA